MSVTRVQLVGNVSTGASFAGIVTATSFIGNVTGTATGLSGSPNITVGTIGATSLNASGVVTATSFVGSGANLTGISSVSFATTSFGLSGTPNITVTGVNASGVVTATSFVGSGANLTNLNIPATSDWRDASLFS